MSLRELNIWLTECPDLWHDRASVLGRAWAAWRQHMTRRAA